MMKKFIVVIHGWHVHSKGFDVHEIYAESAHQARLEACGLKDARESKFDKCAFEVIEISETEFVSNRRLSIKERIFGRIIQ